MTNTAKSSQMENMTSITTAGTGGGDYDDDAWDQEMSSLQDSAGQANNQAMAAARAHLAAVAEEIATMQSYLSDGRIPSRIGSEDTGPEQGATANQAPQDLEKSLRHMQVDLDSANARVDRLAQENEELLSAQARLEADLRAARHHLEEMSSRLKHSEVDQRKSPGAASPAKAAVVPLKAATEEMLAPRPAVTLSKQQATAALRALQVQLEEERKRRANLEKRVQQDQERLQRVVDIAEAQQMENRTLQKRYLLAEAHAQGCLSRLHQVSLQSSRPDSSAEATSEISARHLAMAPFGGYGSKQGSSSSAGMYRQKSAPTRLPSVAR